MENDSDWRVQGEVRLWMGVRSELLPGPPRPAGLSPLAPPVGGTFRSTPTSTIITLTPFSRLSARPQLADSSGSSPVEFTYALSNLSLTLTILFLSYSTRIQIIFYCTENSYTEQERELHTIKGKWY